MNKEQSKSKQFSDNPKSTLVAGSFYTFLILTIIAFLAHIFNLGLFMYAWNIPEPNYFISELVKAALKTLELVFVYRMLTKKSFWVCIIISVLQTALVGFLPLGNWQSLADAVLMFAFPLIFRKDRGWAIVDTIFIYIVMCLYGSLFLLAKFGGFSPDYNYLFYANVIGVIDYKLFVVTMYLFIKYKGGVKLWMKRKLLS